MDKQSLYLETSLVSYAAGRISSNHKTAIVQEGTKEWWNNYRHKYNLFISELVLDEIKSGDPAAIQERKDLISDIEVLPVNNQIFRLAIIYFELLNLPVKYFEDCLHIAYCTHYEMDFLATCNLTHIANPVFITKIHDKNRELGKFIPIIVNPENLLAFEKG